MSNSELSPTPNIIWRLFVLGGLGTLGAISVNDDAWETFDDLTGGLISREMARVTLAGALALHTTEAMSAWPAARKAGLRHPAWWSLSTLLWGFPVLLRLHRSRRRLAAAA